MTDDWVKEERGHEFCSYRNVFKYDCTGYNLYPECNATVITSKTLRYSISHNLGQ